MTIYQKDEIRSGIFLIKDGPAIFSSKSNVEPATAAPSLTQIAEKLERVRKKLAVIAQFVGQRK